MAEAIETAIYKMGVQEADYVRGMRAASAADAEKIKSSEQVSQSEEKVDKSFRTTTQGLERRLGRMSEAIRIEQQYAKDLAYQQRIETEGVGTAQQRAAHLELINKRYNEQTAALKNTGGATQAFGRNVGLARHELVNMSRQVQDIGVSLASGQSPFTVLVQQGTQVADIFATSTGSVRGFFGQALGFAGRFVTSIAGVATGVAALGATFIGATASFASGQKEIERSLMGIGRVSGATVDDINRIADATSSLGTISTSEARTIATAYAAAGLSVRDSIAPLTSVTRDFALVTGQSVEEAAQGMAKAFRDPLKGADELNKVLGFLNDKVREQIRLAERAGDIEGARAILLREMRPALESANELVSKHGSLWTGVANFISKAWDELGKFGSRLTGIGQTTQEEMAGIESEITRILDRIARLRRNRGASEEQEEQLRKLTERYGELADKITKAAEASEKAKFDQKALEIGNFVRATIPGITAVADLEAGIRKLNEALDEPRIRAGLGVSVEEVERARSALMAQRDGLNELREAYGNVSTATARRLQDMELEAAMAMQTTEAGRALLQVERLRNQLKVEAIPVAEREQLITQSMITTLSQLAGAYQNSANQRMFSAQQQVEAAQLEARLVNASFVVRQREQALLRQTQVIHQQLFQQYGATGLAAIRAGNQAALAAQLAGTATAQLELAVRRLQVAELEEAQAAMDGDVNAIKMSQERIAAIHAEIEAIQQRQAAAQQSAAGIIQAYNSELSAASSTASAIAQLQETQRQRAEAESRNHARRMNQLSVELGAMQQLTQFELNVLESAKANLPQYTNDYSIVDPRAAQVLALANAQFGEGGFQTKSTGGQFSVFTAPPNQQGLEFMTDRLLKRGGSIIDAINKTIDLGPLNDTNSQFIQQLTNLIPEDQQIGVIEQQLENLSKQPITLAREQLIHQLNESLERLRESTDSLENTMQISLDPIFSQGHEALKIGYYKAATGLDGIVQGSGGVDSVPVHVMATPGERVTFTPPGQQPNSGRTTVINQTINFPSAAVGERRRSARQLAEGFSRGLSAIH